MCNVAHLTGDSPMKDVIKVWEQSAEVREEPELRNPTGELI